MSLRKWVRQNREVLRRIVGIRCPNCDLTLKALEEWVANDEDLYTWARRDGANL